MEFFDCAAKGLLLHQGQLGFTALAGIVMLHRQVHHSQQGQARNHGQ